MQHFKNLLLTFGFALLFIAARSQSVVPVANEDTVKINNLLNAVEEVMMSDIDKAQNMAIQGRDLAKAQGFKSGEARALKLIGNSFYYKGEPIEAISNWEQSLAILREIKDEANVARLLGNLGTVYANQEDDEKALSSHLEALKIAEKIEDKQYQFTALNNIAGVYFTKPATWEKALDYINRSFSIAETIEIDSTRLGGAYGNAAAIYLENKKLKEADLNFKKALSLLGRDNRYSPFTLNGLGKIATRKGNYDQAIAYHKEALASAEKINRPLVPQAFIGLAEAYFQKKNYEQAFKYYDDAENSALELKTLTDLKDIYEKTALAYANVKDFANAFTYQVKLDKIKEDLYDDQVRKKVGLLQYDFDLTKKQGEVDLLTKDKALKDAELKRQRTQKYAFTIGFILIFIIAVIIFRNYRAKVKINKILDFQKDQIEHLLLNILPGEVAKELQHSGHATPRYYESVSVLFTDFKSFTSIADKMSPQDLVDVLNDCFVAFDEIADRFNVEKIKTIGDSYMCAAGIPTPDPDHAYNIVKAGLAIQQWVIRNNHQRKEKGLVPWDIRVGIHSGPIVAGVVGKKKYAYDIWGSTVNIASRMESNGEPGQVNISSAVYELIKDRYACKHRGKIYAKNVGEIDMYFIEHEIENFVPATPSLKLESKNSPDTAEKKIDVDSLFG
jgi:adenylate cyclase